MKKNKFEQGEEVLYKENKEIITAVKKDFASKKITYRLQPKDNRDIGLLVDEVELIKIPVKKASVKEKVSLVEVYEKVLGKPVPVNKRKDEVWIASKIKEAGEAAERLENEKETPYKILSKLNQEQLEDLILEKELDIEPADYASKEDLLTAVCEELGIKKD